jgi:hypothetical protein
MHMYDLVYKETICKHKEMCELKRLRTKVGENCEGLLLSLKKNVPDSRKSKPKNFKCYRNNKTLSL